MTVEQDDVLEALIEQATNHISDQQSQRRTLNADRPRVVAEVLRIAERNRRRDNGARIRGDLLRDGIRNQVVAGGRVRAVLLGRAHRHNGRGAGRDLFFDFFPGHFCGFDFA